MSSSFRKLIVWQKSMNLVAMIYDAVKKLPREELYSLTDQIKRSAVSIPSNIAEGHSRSSTREFIRFLSIASGSCAELETQILLCVKIKYLKMEDIKEIIPLIDEVARILNSIKTTLEDKDDKYNGLTCEPYAEYGKIYTDENLDFDDL